MQLIVYDGWPVALAGADEVHLHPALLELAELEAGHALVRFACALALWWMLGTIAAVLTGA